MDDNLRGFYKNCWIYCTRSLTLFDKLIFVRAQVARFFFFFFVVDLDWLAFDDLHSQFQDQRFNLASLHLARWRATHVSVSLNFLQTSKRAHRDIITPTAPFCHLLLISTHFCTFSFISFRAMCTRNRLTISGR